jgi:hypothetical protein
MYTYIKHITKSFENAENNTSKVSPDILAIDGMTGVKTRHFYNNLLNYPDARYLEIGTWKGSSVCAAMFDNSANITCIDNWSEFGGPKTEFLDNFNKFKGTNNAHFIEANCFTLDITQLPFKYNIYMYDGNHSSDSHYRALAHYYNVLDNTFIFIVDDWNDKNIRNATCQAIKDLNLIILYEKEIRLTNDDTHTPVDIARVSWWNGIYVVLLEKNID